MRRNSYIFQINGCENKNAKQLHISYHNGDHYSSVRKIGDISSQPANIKLEVAPTCICIWYMYRGILSSIRKNWFCYLRTVLNR